MRGIVLRTPGAPLEDAALRSTTLAVVATNVELTKTALTKLAMMANCGASRAIRPYHTTGDGDQLFAVSTGQASAFGYSADRSGIARGGSRRRGDRPWRSRGDERRGVACGAGSVARRCHRCHGHGAIARPRSSPRSRRNYQWVFFASVVSFAIFVITRGRECRRLKSVSLPPEFRRRPLRRADLRRVSCRRTAGRSSSPSRSTRSCGCSRADSDRGRSDPRASLSRASRCRRRARGSARRPSSPRAATPSASSRPAAASRAPSERPGPAVVRARRAGRCRPRPIPVSRRARSGRG